MPLFFPTSFLMMRLIHVILYHNDPNFLDQQAWVNSADLDQTAPLANSIDPDQSLIDQSLHCKNFEAIFIVEIISMKFEPRREKTYFLHIYVKTKAQISCAVTVQLISAFVFAT